MLTRRLTLVAAVAVALPVVAAFAQERARPRSGGSHGSTSTGRSAGAGRSAGSGAAPGASYRAQPRHGLTEAQRRHPRAGTGTNWARKGYPYYGGYYPYWGYGGWGYPYYDYGWGYPYYGWGAPYFGWGGYYGWGYWDPGPGYAYAVPAPGAPPGSVRLIVEPLDARVFVDGRYAGVVDDFDGLFQRLDLAPGSHEIRLEREGYRTHRFEVYVQEGTTLKLRHEMVEGEGASEERVGAAAAPGASDRTAPGPAGAAERPQAPAPAIVRLDVRPDDATVYLDGAFAGSARELREMRLPPGRHRLELVRPGHRTLERELDLAPGDERRLELSLEPAG